MLKHAPSETVHPKHPVLVEAVMRDCPPGFTLIRQMAHVKNLGKIVRQAEEEFGGKDNVVVLAGHFELFDAHKVGQGKGYVAVLRPKGCRVYARQVEKKQRRMITVDGRTVEAGEPDWGVECALCCAVPTVPQTHRCGVCQFGEFKCANGNW